MKLVQQYVLSAVIAASLLSSLAHGTEWSAAKSIGPGVRSEQYTAAVLGSSVYVFVSTRNAILYRWTDEGSTWLPRHGWERVKADTSYAAAAIAFQNKIFLFYTTGTGTVVYRTFDGASFSEPTSTRITTSAGPSVAAHAGLLYLLGTGEQGITFTSFDGAKWSDPVSLTGRQTNVAPAAAGFEGRLHIFVSASDGRFSFVKLPIQTWTDIDCMGCTVTASHRLTAVNSRDKLLLFTTVGTPLRLVMRVLDRGLGRDVFLPEDGWIDVGEAAGPVAAASVGETIFLVSAQTTGVPGVLPVYPRTTGVSYQFAKWTDVPLAVIQAADDDCKNPADLTKVGTWIQYANLVYAPLLISFSASPTVTRCNTKLQGRTFDQSTAEAVAGEANFKGKVVIIFRARASGGAFSDAGSKIVAMPEDMIVCDQNGTSSLNFYNNDLAHELGHYFGLPHTFHNFSNNVPTTKADLEMMLKNAMYRITAAFDGDLEQARVGDTPPDPHYEMNNVSPDKCAKKDAHVLLMGEGGKMIGLVPPRTNVMSYYQISGTIINKLTPGQRRVLYRFIKSKIGT